MTSLFSGPQAAYLAIAVIVLGLSLAGIVWVGRVIRGELGAAGAPADDPFRAPVAEQIPPAMMKEAIARGLVAPARLAAMTPMERTFFLASLRQKLEGAPTAAAGSAGSDAAPPPAGRPPEGGHPAAAASAGRPPEAGRPPAAVHPAAAASPPPPARAAATMPPASELPPAMVALLNAEKLRLWCPMCGTELQLPIFPPLLARCTECGMKSAVRREEGGRYVVSVSPPAKGG